MNKYCILIFLIFASCKKNNNNLSIPTPKMVSMLADVHCVENTVTYLTPVQKDSILKIYYQQIFEIHSVSEREFLENLDKVKHDPTLMATMYKYVSDTLSARLKVINGN